MLAAATQLPCWPPNLSCQPYEPPEPLPEITAEDVNLICWLALQPAETHSASENSHGQ